MLATNGTYWWLLFEPLKSQKSRQGMRRAVAEDEDVPCRATWHLPQQQLPRGPCSWVRIWSKLKVPHIRPATTLGRGLSLRPDPLLPSSLRHPGHALEFIIMIFGVSAIPETCCYSLSRGVAACGQKLNYNNMLRFSSRKKVFSLACLPSPPPTPSPWGFFFFQFACATCWPTMQRMRQPIKKSERGPINYSSTRS